MVVYNNKTGEVTVKDLGLDTTGLPRPLWYGGVAVDDVVYMTPSGADTLLAVNVTSLEVVSVPVHIGNTSRGALKWLGLAHHDGALYAAPYNADSLLVCPLHSDLSAITCSGLPLPSTNTDHEKWSGIGILGGKLVCTPWSAEDLLVITPRPGKQASARLVNLGVMGKGGAKWMGSAPLAGGVAAVPGDSGKLLLLEMCERPPPDHGESSGVVIGVLLFFLLIAPCLLMGGIYIHTQDESAMNYRSYTDKE
eukprot:Sspe_Gene.55084::Locus_30335_Transcript_1_1_Confidence_1.000_Length_754::g.55084::m.55084